MTSPSLPTIMPDLFQALWAAGLSGQALQGTWTLQVHNIRDVTTDRHRTVDDTPFGGGAGMVFRPDVVDQSLALSADAPGPLIHFSPRGEPLNKHWPKNWPPDRASAYCVATMKVSINACWINGNHER